MWPFKRKSDALGFQQLVNAAKRQHESSDLARRQQLINEAKRQQAESQEAPVVALEDFFTGNEDCGSMGCNLTKNGVKPPALDVGL